MFLEGARLRFRGERDSRFDFPRLVLRGVRTITSVVVSQADGQIARYTCLVN